MDQTRLLSKVAIAGVIAVLVGGLVACGGGEESPTTTAGGTPQQPAFTDDRDGLASPDPAEDRANRAPRGLSVDYNDPPPPIAAAVRAAADAAGCTTASFRSEVVSPIHIPGEAAAKESVPPVSGSHNDHWADYGVYNRPVPFKYQLHNLEHGGIFTHYGTAVPVDAVNTLRTMWAKSPAYLLIAPDTHPAFPTDAVVAGSWQRWIVCKPFAAAQVTAIEAFVREYRGRGPEQASARNTGEDAPDDLPDPELPDPGAG